MVKPRPCKADFSVQSWEDALIIFIMKFTSNKILLKRLNDLKAQCAVDNWDGYNAYALEATSLENTEAIIKIASNDVLSHFNLFPSPNGTLSFEIKDKKVGAMSVGNTQFSYAALKEGKAVIKGAHNMDYQLAAQKLKEIVEYLK